MEPDEVIRELKYIIRTIQNGWPARAVADIRRLADRIPVEGIQGWGIDPETRCNHCQLNPCILPEKTKDRCLQRGY